MLHIESRGCGPDLVMLHGWGMHSGVWDVWADRLAERFRVHLIDLPGHGHSQDVEASSLDEWAQAAMQVAPSDAWWLGWSLGGLVSMNVANLYGDRLRGLVLLSSTPKFVTAADWPFAVDAEVFDQFAGQLDQDIGRTLTRFLALQVRGSDNSGAALKMLRAQLSARPQAQAGSLNLGLKLLQNSDLRTALKAINLPLYWLFGERDTLVPAAVAGEVEGIKTVIEGAGHAPFLSHPQACADSLSEWLLAGGKGVGCANC